MIEKITVHYELKTEEQEKLREAVEESRVQFKIIAGNAGSKQRKAALQFARSFEDMDDETATRILELLRKKGD